MLVFVARDAPVEEVHVETLAKEVLDEAVARYQVQDVGLEDQRVGQQYGDRVLLLFFGLVVVELGFVLFPDRFFGGLARFDPRSPQNEVRARGVLFEANGLRVVVAVDAQRYKAPAFAQPFPFFPDYPF